MSVFTGGPYGRLAVMINTLSSLNIEIIIAAIYHSINGFVNVYETQLDLAVK